MKSFSISFVTRSLVCGLLLLLVAFPAESKKKRRQKAEDLVNVFLSPQYSQWLVGPIARIATAEEVTAYLVIADDQEAETFIKEFWDRRGGDQPWPAKGPGQIFRERAEEADKFYREGTYQGHRTDRGTIHTLHGLPEQVRYERSGPPRRIPLEIWIYPRDSPTGLDGKVPERAYYFTKGSDLTVFYVGPLPRPTR